MLTWRLQVFGGLIVGMVVKYSDNIMKNFANALSVIFTVVGAIPLFGQYPSIWFLAGSLLVSLSLFMYQRASTAGFGNFKRMYRTMSTSLLLGSAHGEFHLDVYSVLNLHVRLHVHEVLTRLAHHLRLSLRLRMRVRSMCHHRHLARMTGLWCVAWVSVRGERC